VTQLIGFGRKSASSYRLRFAVSACRLQLILISWADPWFKHYSIGYRRDFATPDGGQYNDCLIVLRYRFVDVLEVFTTIILTSRKNYEVANALTIKKKVERIDFVFIIAMMPKILEASTSTMYHNYYNLRSETWSNKANELMKPSLDKFESMKN